MAINNLEQAAMTAASTGVTPTRVPQYEDRAGDEWMSYVPEAYGQLPDAIRRQRQREVSELESGIPEAIRQAAQPMSRRGLYGSGLQLEDIGQAALQRQIAIDKAKTLAEIDPLKAQIAMGDLAQQRGTQRAQESRRRYEQEEAYSQQQKARDDLMKQAAGSGILSTLTGRNPISDLLFGKQTSPLEQALLASVTGGKGLGTGASQQGLVQKLAASLGLGKLFGLPDTPIPEEWQDWDIPRVASDPNLIIEKPVEDLNKLRENYNLLSNEIKERLLPNELEMLSGEGGYEETTDQFADLFTDSGEFIPMTSQLYEQQFPGTLDVDVFDDEFDFGGTSSPTRTDGLGGNQVSMQEAIKQGQENYEITQKLLDEGKIGKQYASLVSDTSLDYSPDTKILPSEAEMLAGEGGSMYGDLDLPTYGGFGEGVDLGTEGWDSIDDVGEGTNIFSEAGQAAGELAGKIPSTVGALAIASALNPEGIKGIASNPFSFIGPQIMGAGKVGIGNIAGSLLKGQMPSFTGAAMSPLAASVVGLPIALMGMGAAKGKKDRARDEAEEMRNRSGSARFNFVPGELHMVGNKRRSPALDEANRNFMLTDQLTGMGRIYEEDPRRSVMDGDSLSKRGQDFGREAGIDYTNPDPDIQNTSQKWLGKQQVYSELIPELKPIFMAGLKGQMPREQVEDMVAEISNKFFEENPAIGQISGINKRIKDIEHFEADELGLGSSSVVDQIMALEFQREGLKENVPEGWKHMAAFKPMPVIISIIEDEQE